MTLSVLHNNKNIPFSNKSYQRHMKIIGAKGQFAPIPESTISGSKVKNMAKE